MPADDLAIWLLEQIAEDGRCATVVDPDGLSGQESWHTQRCGYRQGEWQESCDCAVPARVLAECDAKRRIIEFAQKIAAEVRADGSNVLLYGQHLALQAVLKHMAQPLAGCPGYRQEWQP